MQHNTRTTSLPSPHQIWAHSTCSIKDLETALSQKNPVITAIEADVIMGSTQSFSEPRNDHIPILAHPPQVISDLTLSRFLQHTMAGNIHLKLDFKDAAAVLPALNLIQQQEANKHKTIFFNADILPGPGYRQYRPTIDADFFLSSCLQPRIIDKHVCVAFSLGWTVDCRAILGYTHNDIEQLIHLIQKYDLLSRTQGVVVPVNARILSKNMKPLAKLLHQTPNDKVQLLIWTGTGEPPISSFLLQYLKRYFYAQGLSDRVGYDCKVLRNPLKGLFIDLLVSLVGILWTIHRFFTSPKKQTLGS